MTHTTTELDAFVDALRRDALVERGVPVVVARAPGRLDVMGGIADYSGSLVLQRPIAEATFAAVQRIDRPVLDVVSVGREPHVIPLDLLVDDDGPVSYQRARTLFANDGGVLPHWLSYVVGS